MIPLHRHFRRRRNAACLLPPGWDMQIGGGADTTRFPAAPSPPALRRSGNGEVGLVPMAVTWNPLPTDPTNNDPDADGLFTVQETYGIAFVLLNVTDGHGNVAHADMETLAFSNALQDFSPNGLTLWTFGDPTIVPAVHGRGMAFDGTDDKVQTGSESATALNAITTAMTVSLFFRPAVDYDSTLAGSAFHAFAERSDSGETLWRFGWDASTDSLSFRIRSGSTDYTVSTAYSLHKGTWYHLAATLSGGYQRIYVDGVQVAVISGTPSVKTGTQILYVGYDFPSNTYLKGTLDEVAVYSVSKTAAALKAMATFVQGSNALIVPRGLWYESKLNQTLDGSDPRSSNPVLNKMTVQANQFAVSGTLTLDAYLNARPVQMVLSGNVTLEEAQWFVDQLRLNRTGKTTAFLLDVTDEFYTVGFVGAVIALAPNATVDNSVNHTASAPPTPWWAQLFNAIVSVAAIAWNAALAVAAFFVNLVKWLVNIVVGLVIGLATGDWTYFVDNVVKPFVEAMAKLIKWIIDFINAVVKAVADYFLKPIIDMMNDWALGVASGMDRVSDSSTNQGIQASSLADTILVSPFPGFVFGLSSAVIIVLSVLGVIATVIPVGGVSSIIISVLKSIVKTAVEHWIPTTLAVSMVLAWAISFVPGGSQVSSGFLGAMEVVWGAIMIGYAMYRKQTWTEDALALFLNLMGMFLVFNVLPLAKWTGSKVIAALVGTAISAGGLLLALHGEDIAPPPLGQVDEFLEAVVLGFDIVQTGIVVSDCLTRKGC